MIIVLWINLFGTHQFPNVSLDKIDINIQTKTDGVYKKLPLTNYTKNEEKYKL
jgi:hypothetical protein